MATKTRAAARKGGSKTNTTAAGETRKLVDAMSSQLAVIEFDMDGTVRTANQNFLAVLGYSLAEIQGQHHRLFVDGAYALSPAYRDFWAKWLKPGGTFCGDEYSSDFPACLRKTYQLAMEWNATVSHAGLFWWMRKPATSLASGAQDAARATH